MLDKVGAEDTAVPDRASTALSSIRGIILAGAYPRHDSALDRLSPRPMLPVALQPLIMYSLRWLSRGGLGGATVCANSAARAVCEDLRTDGLGLDLSYLEDWTPRGAAGCVRDAAVGTDARTFVVIDGTTIPTVDMRELLEAHSRSRAVLTVVVSEDHRADEGGNRRLRPTGLYVFDRNVIAYVPEEGFQDIKEGLIPRLHRAGEPVSTFSAQGASPRVVDGESYLALNHWAIERASDRTEFDDGFRASGQAWVHETASVHSTALLLGPVVLGPNVSVQSDAAVIGPSSIGAGSVVGRGAVVSRSVVWSRCLVGDDAFIDRCTLGDGAIVSSRAAVYSAMRVPSERGGLRHTPAKRPVARGAWDSVGASLRPPAAHPR